MYFQVRVRVDVAKMAEFGAKLASGALDGSAIRGETYCLADDPTVGYSVWEAPSGAAFDDVFSAWKPYYCETEIRTLITAEAMKALAR